MRKKVRKKERKKERKTEGEVRDRRKRRAAISFINSFSGKSMSEETTSLWQRATGFSPVWQHAERNINNPHEVRCTKCERIFRNPSTSTLRTHLLRLHNMIIENVNTIAWSGEATASEVETGKTRSGETKGNVSKSQSGEPRIPKDCPNQSITSLLQSAGSRGTL